MAFQTLIMDLPNRHLGLCVQGDAAEDQGFEIEESTTPVTEAGSLEDQTRADAYLKHWHPEDATAEVWSQGASDTFDYRAVAHGKSCSLPFRFLRKMEYGSFLSFPRTNPEPAKSCAKLRKANRPSKLWIAPRMAVLDLAEYARGGHLCGLCKGGSFSLPLLLQSSSRPFRSNGTFSLTILLDISTNQ